MDTIKLLKGIDKKIKEAKNYLPVLLEIFEQLKGIKLTYRIKDKNRILEKVMLFSNSPKFQDMNEIEILNEIRDIIGLTIIINKLESKDIMILDEILWKLANQTQPIKLYKLIDHTNDIIGTTGKTGYKCLLLTFDSEKGMPFEVQITDNENLAIREATHKKFEEIKYAKVRNPNNKTKKVDNNSIDL